MVAEEKGPKVDDFKWPFERRLRKPIQVDGDDVSFITMREPTTEDMIELGVLDGTFNGPNVIKMIARLSKATPVLLSRQLHPSDFFALMSYLTDFFMAAANESKST
jgi:hypothetical protein